MDHFATFNPTTEPFEVECLFHTRSPLSYVSGGFHGFPERIGWRQRKSEAATADGLDLLRRPRAQVDEFLQSWLYVGLLSEWTEIIGLPLNLNEFIRLHDHDSEKKSITTVELPSYCKLWALREAILVGWLSEAEYQQHKKSRVGRLRPLLQDVLAWTTGLYDLSESNAAGSRPLTGLQVDTDTSPRRLISEEFYTAVLALRLSIASAAKIIWNLPSTEGINPDYEGRELFLSRLLENGWCPHDVQYLGNTVTLDACYYMCSYGPTRARRDHKACDKDHCQADVYDNSEGYKFRHKDGCSCTPTPRGPDTKALLLGFASHGGYPLLVVKNNGSKSTEEEQDVEVLPFDPAEPVEYIAFSHVWADGLGNPTCNKLPPCQLLELQQMANAAYYFPMDVQRSDPIPFWIDTLCVPRGEGTVGEDKVNYRELAMQRMRATYQMAKKVLVLDKEILSGSMKASPRERLARIALSTWQRRLWTFQEGFLAQQLLLQFLDGCCLMKDVVDAEQANPEKIWSPGGLALAGTFWGTFGFSKTEPHEDRIFASAFHPLQWRSTTVAGDETLCLAVIMGIDPLPVLKVANRDALRSREDSQDLLAKRIQMLLQLIKRLPPGIIFLTGNRLVQDGFKWAPAQLLGLRGKGIDAKPLQQTYIASLHHERRLPGAGPPNMAELVEGGGLKVRMLSIALLSFEVGKIDRRFKLVHLRPERAAESYEVRLYDEGEIIESVIGRDGDGMVILMNNQAVSHRDFFKCSHSIGALVSLRDDDVGEYRKVNFVCRVTVAGNRIIDLPEDPQIPPEDRYTLVITDEEDLSRPMVVSKELQLQTMGKWQIF